MEIIISNNANKPIYEQITSQMKAMIMSGELQAGDAIPSMRALAKSIHVSVITVQKAYEDFAKGRFHRNYSRQREFCVSAKQRILSGKNNSVLQRNIYKLPQRLVGQVTFLLKTDGVVGFILSGGRMSMKNILELQQVSKTFLKSNFTLEDVTFSLPYGSILGFVGENGAGKTTTIGCILNTIKKDSGTIKLFGQEMLDADTSLREKLVLSTMVTIFPLTGQQSNYQM